MITSMLSGAPETRLWIEHSLIKLAEIQTLTASHCSKGYAELTN